MVRYRVDDFNLSRKYCCLFSIYSNFGFLILVYSKGTAVISVSLVTTAFSPYLLPCLPRSIKQTSVVTRCTALFLLNVLFLAPLGALDLVLDRYPDGGLAFGGIFVMRALQGLVNGVLFLILQVTTFISDHSFQTKNEVNC